MSPPNNNLSNYVIHRSCQIWRREGVQPPYLFSMFLNLFIYLFITLLFIKPFSKTQSECKTNNLNNANEALARSLWIRTHSRHLECELLLDDRLVHLLERSQVFGAVVGDCVYKASIDLFKLSKIFKKYKKIKKSKKSCWWLWILIFESSGKGKVFVFKRSVVIHITYLGIFIETKTHETNQKKM